MILIVEGNIGAGKSTFIKLCADQLRKRGVDVVPVYEQVGDWTNLTDSTGKSMFDLYYEDRQKYAYVFQSYVLFSRVSAIQQAIKDNPGKVIICERSFFTDYEIFAKTLFESGDMNEMEWNVYNMWHDKVVNLLGHPIAHTIYLRASPIVCFDRIKHRNRQSENLIEFAYIDNLHKKHEEWLMKPVENTKTLVLNANVDVFEDKLALSSFVDALHDLIVT